MDFSCIFEAIRDFCAIEIEEKSCFRNAVNYRSGNVLLNFSLGKLLRETEAPSRGFLVNW